jgi:hypothetical protein
MGVSVGVAGGIGVDVRVGVLEGTMVGVLVGKGVLVGAWVGGWGWTDAPVPGEPVPGDPVAGEPPVLALAAGLGEPEGELVWAATGLAVATESRVAATSKARTPPATPSGPAVRARTRTLLVRSTGLTVPSH